MNKSLPSRLEALEAQARRWKLDNKIHESIVMENSKAQVNTWTQKQGQKRGAWIDFDNPRAALDWTIAQLSAGTQAQIWLDDIRDVMTDEQRAVFDLLYFDADRFSVVFDLREGRDVMSEAFWMWSHRTMAGVRQNEFWEKVDARLSDLFQSLDDGPDLELVPA